jgi:histidinol phosphatase-like PHP family hydrolase
VRHEAHDLHVHTNRSKDVSDPRSTFEGLAGLGRGLGIALGFADHFEADHMGREAFCFGPANVDGYFDAYDEAKAAYPELSLGVEAEFYPHRPELNALTAEWLDLHRRELDRVLGSAHFVFDRWAVTWEPQMRLALEVHTFMEVLDAYLEGLGGLVASGMADCLPHADAVFRGNDRLIDLSPGDRAAGDARVLDVCRAAVGRGMAVELNLIGVADTSGAGPSPPWATIETLVREGARVFVGSDTHGYEQLPRAAPHVREACARLRRMGARTLV